MASLQPGSALGTKRVLGFACSKRCEDGLAAGSGEGVDHTKCSFGVHPHHAAQGRIVPSHHVGAMAAPPA